MKNKVELLGYYGNDNRHALAAWASTFFELDLEMPDNINTRVDYVVEHILSKSKRMRGIKDLIMFLGQNKHTSPFRFSALDFATTTDIATHIHFLKHTVSMSCENAESARYKELKEDKQYVPDDWPTEWKEKLIDFNYLSNKLYHQAIEELSKTLGRKRAKESARFFKTYSSQINSQKMFSFDGFAQIYFKRNLNSASQLEIGYVVEEMLEQIKSIEGNPFEYSLQAFNL